MILQNTTAKNGMLIPFQCIFAIILNVAITLQRMQNRLTSEYYVKNDQQQTMNLKNTHTYYLALKIFLVHYNHYMNMISG
jgi:hypothetical protein